MPYSLEFPLNRVRTLANTGGEKNRALDAMFYRWIHAAEPGLGRFAHEQSDPKPFTLSPLQNNDAVYRFRLTLLEDDYYPYIASGVRYERTVRIDRNIFELDGEPHVEHHGYDEIDALALTNPEIILSFESPTSFHVKGMDDPLPFPRRVFESYLRRWNAFSGEPIEPRDDFLEWIETHLAVSRLEVATQSHMFETYIHIGCVGRVQYRVAKRISGNRERIRQLNALADYAYFCGTGHKTTQGMGQTRRLAEWSA